MSKKNLNKLIVWLFLWTAIWWLSFFWKRKKIQKLSKNLKKDLYMWLKDMKKTFENFKKSKNANKKK